MIVDYVAVDRLTDLERREMLHLLCQHFSGVDRACFEADLAEKSLVLMLREDNSAVLKGFSTLLFYNTLFEGETIDIIFSGDTIVDPSAWSSPALAQGWIQSVHSHYDTLVGRKLYWFLISSGFRTYRFLSIFCNEFFPNYRNKTPAREKRLMDHLGAEKFGKHYLIDQGIVRFPQPHQLRDHLAGIPDARRSDLHVNFFEQVNPGHGQGDELVCVAKFSEANLTRAGRRIWNQALGSGSGSQRNRSCHSSDPKLSLIH